MAEAKGGFEMLSTKGRGENEVENEVTREKEIHKVLHRIDWDHTSKKYIYIIIHNNIYINRKCKIIFLWFRII